MEKKKFERDLDSTTLLHQAMSGIAHLHSLDIGMLSYIYTASSVFSEIENLVQIFHVVIGSFGINTNKPI